MPPPAALLTAILVLILAGGVHAQHDPASIRQGVEGELTEANLRAEYTFEGQAGEIYSVSAWGEPAFLFALIVSAPDGSILSDVRDYWDPRMDTGYLQLPASGTYRVSLVGDQPTRYSAQLVKRETPVLADQDGQRDYFYAGLGGLDFTFEALAGDDFVLSATSDSFDPVLILVSPSGEEIAQDDDSGGNLQPRIGPITLGESGLYRLIVRAVNPGGSGVIVVDARKVTAPEQNAIPSIDYGEWVTATVDSETRQRRFQFTAAAGDVIALRAGEPEAEIRIEQLNTASQPIITSTVLNRNARYPRLHERMALMPGAHVVIVSTLKDTPVEVRFKIEKVGANSLDFTGIFGDGSPQFSVYLSDKNDGSRTRTFTVYDDGGSNGMYLRVQQGNYGQVSAPFRVVITQNDETVASYTLDSIVGLTSIDIEIDTAMIGLGEAQIHLELLEGGPVWFALSREFTYGIG